MEKLYEFLYCPCIHESAPMTVSIHRTKEGAGQAMEKHKMEELKEWEEIHKGSTEEHRRKYPYDWSKLWSIQEIEIQD